MQEMLDLHASIVDRKKKALERSTAEIAKWEKKIDDLEAEMLVAESDKIAADFESEAMATNNSARFLGMESAITDAVEEIVDNNSHLYNDMDVEDDGDGEVVMNVHEDIDDEKVSALADE